MSYKYLFQGVTRSVGSPGQLPSRQTQPAPQTSILYTCRQCRREATPILYSTAVIKVGNGENLLHLQDRIGPDNYLRIKTLVVDYFALYAHEGCKVDFAALGGVRHLIITYGLFLDGVVPHSSLPTSTFIRRAVAGQAPGFPKFVCDMVEGLWGRLSLPQSTKADDRRFAVSFYITIDAKEPPETFEVWGLFYCCLIFS